MGPTSGVSPGWVGLAEPGEGEKPALHHKAGSSWMNCTHPAPGHRLEISPKPPFSRSVHPFPAAPRVPCIPPSLQRSPSSPEQFPVPRCHRELHQSLHKAGGISTGLKVYFASKSDKHTRPGGSVISAELFPADIGLK